ncbi:MAG: anti-sigma regulatory factor [Legionellaceae bacterium]|nr:anti-sigma regulatory factor [Legionellaceae bacterium]
MYSKHKKVMMIEIDRKYYNFVIAKDYDVANATHVTRVFAAEIGFNTVMQTMIATAVSELATNIIKYAGRGYITVALIQQMNQTGIEVIAEDTGPGILDRVNALKDNISTGGTLGVGLPGIKRLMDEFIIDSSDGCGTKIITRKWRSVDVSI